MKGLDVLLQLVSSWLVRRWGAALLLLATLALAASTAAYVPSSADPRTPAAVSGTGVATAVNDACSTGPTLLIAPGVCIIPTQGGTN